jgi:hypothetical protein
MLHISLPPLTIQQGVDELQHNRGDKESPTTIWANMSNLFYGKHASVFIHGEDVSACFVTQEEFWLEYSYKLINNHFCALLNDLENTECNKCPFRRRGNDIYIDHKPFGDHHRSLPLHLKKLDLLQAIPEVIRAVKEFKDFYFEIAKRVYPKDPLFCLFNMIGKEEYYTQKLFDDPSYDWLRIYNESQRHHLFHNYTKLKFVENFRQLSPDEKLGSEAGKLLVISTEYHMFPLERAWNEYKVKNNITDADIAAAIAKEETEEKASFNSSLPHSL